MERFGRSPLCFLLIHRPRVQFGSGARPGAEGKISGNFSLSREAPPRPLSPGGPTPLCLPHTTAGRHRGPSLTVKGFCGRRRRSGGDKEGRDGPRLKEATRQRARRVPRIALSAPAPPLSRSISPGFGNVL